MYVAGGYAPNNVTMFHMIDISDPASPQTLASADMENSNGHGILSASGPYAYVDEFNVVQLCLDLLANPAISLSTTSLSASNDQGVNPPHQFFDIANSGDGTLTYIFSTDASWLKFDPLRGSSMGESDTIEVSFRTKGFSAGDHVGRLFVADPTATNSPQIIDVTVTVFPVYHTLTTVASPPEGGAITGGGIYESVERTVIEALPNEGWEFDHWESHDPVVDGSTQNPEYILMDADKTVTAIFEIAPLTRINLESPLDGSILGSNPMFRWTSDAGTNTAFAVDLSFSPTGPFYSSYENLGQIISDDDWRMPTMVWNMIPSGTEIYWRVRGVDLDAAERTITYSDEVWSFSRPVAGDMRYSASPY